MRRELVRDQIFCDFQVMFRSGIAPFSPIFPSHRRYGKSVLPFLPLAIIHEWEKEMPLSILLSLSLAFAKVVSHQGTYRPTRECTQSVCDNYRVAERETPRIIYSFSFFLLTPSCAVCLKEKDRNHRQSGSFTRAPQGVFYIPIQGRKKIFALELQASVR